MNMDEIMKQYDELQKKQKLNKTPQVSHKKPNALTKEEKLAAKQGYSYEQIMEQESKRRANPMEVWLNRYGTVDKDRIADEKNENAKLHNIDYLKKIKPQATIDLHQLTKDEAWNRLNAFVSECKQKNLKKILIIHGKGIHSNGSDPVLGPMVKMFIEQDKRLGTSGHPDRNNGGNGATWVLIK